jgi:hypothetical protein
MTFSLWQGFFEGFAPIDNSQLLSTKVTFEIPQGAAWVSTRDIVAIYKGDNATCCDDTRSFLSCNRVSLSGRCLLCCME